MSTFPVFPFRIAPASADPLEIPPSGESHVPSTEAEVKKADRANVRGHTSACVIPGDVQTGVTMPGHLWRQSRNGRRGSFIIGTRDLPVGDLSISGTAWK